MIAIANVWLKISAVEELLQIIEDEGKTGIALDIFIADEVNQYDQNVTLSVSQTKEEREDQTPRTYVGNGAVRYIQEGFELMVVERQQREEKPARKSSKAATPARKTRKPVAKKSRKIDEDDDLPF